MWFGSGVWFIGSSIYFILRFSCHLHFFLILFVSKRILSSYTWRKKRTAAAGFAHFYLFVFSQHSSGSALFRCHLATWCGNLYQRAAQTILEMNIYAFRIAAFEDFHQSEEDMCLCAPFGLTELIHKCSHLVWTFLRRLHHLSLSVVSQIKVKWLSLSVYYVDAFS